MNKADQEYRFRIGKTKKAQTGKCPCGNERAPYCPAYCKECIARRSKEYRKNHPKTPEQKAHINRMQNNRRIKKDRKKIRLDPTLWNKPKRVKKDRINGIKICGRPDCNNTENLLSNGWCHSCAAAYRREWRKYHEDKPLSEERLMKHRVRALTRSYIIAGKLIKKPCEICGSEEKIDAHHDDYAKPMDVRWLCKKHHREHHLSIK